MYCYTLTPLTRFFSCHLDYSQGFGGKYGVQTDRQDKSAMGYDSQEKVPLHPSQTDMSKGFGGKFGVDSENKDKVGFFDDFRKRFRSLPVVAYCCLYCNFIYPDYSVA